MLGSKYFSDGCSQTTGGAGNNYTHTVKLAKPGHGSIFYAYKCVYKREVKGLQWHNYTLTENVEFTVETLYTTYCIVLIYRHASIFKF
ncbi:MAG: hypothetical protein EAZ47_02365 [Bacteroidetes bacterium]|nr:MAG: hypothetical protein EAZ47_02365 [Bacteroidota bacterium]